MPGRRLQFEESIPLMLSPPSEAGAILFVDDEATSRKWFARTFGGEFRVVTAAGVGEALEVLGERGQDSPCSSPTTACPSAMG